MRNLQLTALGAAMVAMLVAAPPLGAQEPDDSSDYNSGSSFGDYSGYSGSTGTQPPSGSYNSEPTRATTTSVQRSSNSSYGGSANTYGSSRNSYGQSSVSYSTPSSSSKTSSSSSSVPQSRSYRTNDIDYGTSANTYGSSPNTYRSSPNTYGRSARSGSQRRGSYRDQGIQTRQGQGPDSTNLWAGRIRGVPVPAFPVSGRLQMASGQPAADAEVRLNCGGASYPMGVTDRRGRFRINLTSCYSALSMGDASVGGPFRASGSWAFSLNTCWLDLMIPGHALGRVELRALTRWRRHDLGTVILESLGPEPSPTVHINTLLASPAARKAYQRGLRALRKAKPNYDAAAGHLAEAVRIHRQYATAWAALGEALMALGSQEEAKTAFRKAIDEDPMLLAPHESLLKVALEEENWPEVESLTKSYLDISPTSARVRFYGALAAVNLRKGDDVEAIVKKMKDLGEVETWTTAHYMMAMVHSWRTEFEEAAREFEVFLDRSPDHTLARNASSLLYEWTKLEVIQPRDFPDGPPWQGDQSGL